MTMVHPPRTSDLERKQIDGKLLWAVLVCLVSVLPTPARGAPVHWHHAGAMPPGAIGRQRLIGSGPLSGVCLSNYCQPVEVHVPTGARIAPFQGAAQWNGVHEAHGDGLLEEGKNRLLVVCFPMNKEAQCSRGVVSQLCPYRHFNSSPTQSSRLP